jgi:hypothetical protein
VNKTKQISIQFFDIISLRRAIFKLVLIAQFGATISMNSMAQDDFSIEVKNRQMQKFLGLGFTVHKGKAYFNPTNSSVKEKLYKGTFIGMNSVVFWSYVENPVDRDKFIKTGLQYGLKRVIVNTTGYPKTPMEHANTLLKEIKEYITAGIPVYGTTIMNKPNTDESDTYRQEYSFVPETAKLLRFKLDSAGFTNIKIGGPSTIEWHPYIDPVQNGAAHGYGFQEGDNMAYLNAIIKDTAALKIFDAFDFQSYGWSVSTQVQQLADSLGKDLWVTLAATDGKNNDNGDAVLCPISAANCLANLNHGVSSWNHWVWDQLVNFNTGESNLRMKYLQLIGNNFKEGATFRSAVAQQAKTPPDMQWNYFNLTNPSENIQPEIVAAAALNPDSSWSVAIVNLTGVHAQHFASVYVSGEAKILNGIIKIKELENAGLLHFSMNKLNMQGSLTTSNKTADNGKIDISIGSGEIVVLHSEKTTTSALVNLDDLSEFNVFPNPASDKLYISTSLISAKLEIFNIAGRKIVETTFIPNGEPVDISHFESGIYLVRISNGTIAQTRKFVKK